MRALVFAPRRLNESAVQLAQHVCQSLPIICCCHARSSEASRLLLVAARVVRPAVVTVGHAVAIAVTVVARAITILVTRAVAVAVSRFLDDTAAQQTACNHQQYAK